MCMCHVTDVNDSNDNITVKNLHNLISSQLDYQNHKHGM